LNPLHGTDFIAQTAQFSSLEQLQQINTSLTTLASSSGGTSLDAVLASGYIGKVVEANGTIVEQGGTAPATIRYTLPSGVASVQIQVEDLQGNLVRTIPLGAQPAGLQQFIFDGLGNDGRPLPAGRYVYQVVATDVTGRPVVGVSTASGQVTGVTFDGTHPYLVVGSSMVPLSGVYRVSLAS
jgi:flagellar basal-body rod modification protein FlgD